MAKQTSIWNKALEMIGFHKKFDPNEMDEYGQSSLFTTLTHRTKDQLEQLKLLLESGAALSHHHSVGYEHLPWLSRYIGPVGSQTLQGIKNALDPDNTCNPGKLVPTADSALEHYWPDVVAKDK